MENYLMYNGKKIPLTEERIKNLVEEEKIKSPFERIGEKYYYIDGGGFITEWRDKNDSFDNDAFKVANYCTDKKLIEQRALHEILNRLLWRFTYENGWDEKMWDDINIPKFCINWGKTYNLFSFSWEFNYNSGSIYFISKEIAQKAINEIVLPFCESHPEFVW